MSLQDSTQGYILSSPRTVFTLPSIIVDTQEEDMSKLTKRLHYYIHHAIFLWNMYFKGLVLSSNMTNVLLV